MIKRFLEWIGFKEKIHKKEHKPPFFKEGEIWWCYFGENVGMEMNGKGDYFTRPVLVFKKYDKYSFLGLPLSTKIKLGSWYFDLDFNNKKQIVILSQGRVMDYRRLKELVGKIDSIDFRNIKNQYLNLHK